jgi:hypothetical protein
MLPRLMAAVLIGTALALRSWRLREALRCEEEALRHRGCEPFDILRPLRLSMD